MSRYEPRIGGSDCKSNQIYVEMICESDFKNPD